MNLSPKNDDTGTGPAVTQNAGKLRKLVESMNDTWLNGNTDDMDRYFHKQVVMIEPGTNRKIRGREMMIESYRQFLESSQVSDFRIKDITIDVFEDTAVVLYTFRIHYRVETTNFDEDGTEILVFHRHNNRWLIVWRNQQPSLYE